MRKVEYDLIKLKQHDVNPREAIKHFSSYEDYFAELKKFTDEAKYYLRDYTADIILASEEERNHFREDIKRIKGTLHAMGISYPIAGLTELDYEAKQRDREAITNWLRKCQMELAKAAAAVASAQTEVEGPEPEPEPELPAPKEEAAPIREEKPRILAADDKPELLTAVVTMLEDRFKVMAATSGKAAIKIMEKHPPALFILDIEMPEMDGYELAAIIRSKEQFADTPIIFLTSKSTREDVLAAIQSGGNDYLVKPVVKSLLLEKILRHLGSI